MDHKQINPIINLKLYESDIWYKVCNESKIVPHNTNLVRQYLHDIRDLRTLDKVMINNIRTMSNEDKMSIIIALNSVVETLKTFIE